MVGSMDGFGEEKGGSFLGMWSVSSSAMFIRMQKNFSGYRVLFYCVISNHYYMNSASPWTAIFNLNHSGSFDVPRPVSNNIHSLIH
jgi:hypothetical protein